MKTETVLTVCTLVVVALNVGVAFYCWIKGEFTLRTPIGYEDENGFHAK
jgi:hypothetical protein